MAPVWSALHVALSIDGNTLVRTGCSTAIVLLALSVGVLVMSSCHTMCVSIVGDITVEISFDFLMCASACAALTTGSRHTPWTCTSDCVSTAGCAGVHAVSPLYRRMCQLVHSGWSGQQWHSPALKLTSPCASSKGQPSLCQALSQRRNCRNRSWNGKLGQWQCQDCILCTIRGITAVHVQQLLEMGSHERSFPSRSKLVQHECLMRRRLCHNSWAIAIAGGRQPRKNNCGRRSSASKCAPC